MTSFIETLKLHAAPDDYKSGELHPNGTLLAVAHDGAVRFAAENKGLCPTQAVSELQTAENAKNEGGRGSMPSGMISSVMEGYTLNWVYDRSHRLISFSYHSAP